MRFVPYDASHEAAYLRFAERVGGSAMGRPFAYYAPSDDIAVQRHVLIDDAADPPAVVGAVTTKLQTYVLGGETMRVAVATYPISLGVAEPKYAMAGMVLFRELLKAHPLNLLLGMGPPESNVTAKMCQALGWRLSPVPYLFMPRRLAPLAAKQVSGRAWLAAGLRLAGRLGLFAPLEAIQRLAARRPSGEIAVEPIAAFDAGHDAWWAGIALASGFGLVRGSAALNAMFPPSVAAFERLVLRRGEKIVGYAVLLVPRPEDALAALGANVVTLVDFCAHSADLADAAASLAEHLAQWRIDAVLANFSHAPTLAALQAAGFKPRTTHMYLATSPALTARLDAVGISLDAMVISRADGDGPIGLGVAL